MKATVLSMVLCSVFTLGNSALAQKVAKQSDCEDGRAYLNIRTNTISEEKAEILGFRNAYGSYVSEVHPAGAGHDAGILPFDYLYGINEMRTSDDEDLTDLLGYFHPGEQVTIHLFRDGRAMSINTVLGKYQRWPSARKNTFLGVSQADEDDDEQAGVVVEIVSRSTAEGMGLKDGDRILSINGHPVVDWEDITTAVPLSDPGDPVEVVAERYGRKITLSGLYKSRTGASTASENRMLALDGNLEIKQKEEYAFLGINSVNLTKEKAMKLGFDNIYGSYVTSVIPNTAADRAGIQAFDYIYGVDEYRTGADQSLSSILHKYNPGQRASVQLVRQGRNRSLPVVLGRRNEEGRSAERDKCEKPFLGIRASHDMATEHGIRVDIVENSTAEEMGLEDGDIIVKINGFSMVDWEDISTAIDNMQVGETIKLEILRGNRRMDAAEPIKSYCDTKITTITDWVWDVTPKTVIATNRLDIKNVKVIITDAPGKEVEDLRRKFGLDLRGQRELEIRNIQLVPNSSQGLFKLSFELPSSGQTVVKVINSQGRLIYKYDMGTFQGDFSDNLDIIQNGEGTYYLSIQQDARASARKIILSKA